MILTFIGGVEFGDGIDGSGDWGLYSLSARITGHDIEAGWHDWMLIAKPIWNCGFIGIRFNCDNLRLQRIEEKIVIVPFARAPDNCVDFKTAGVIFLAGLPSFDERSTQKTSDSVYAESKERSGFVAIVKYKEV